jgi:hypothetical protein
MTILASHTLEIHFSFIYSIYDHFISHQNVIGKYHIWGIYYKHVDVVKHEYYKQVFYTLGIY